ncbi:TPA: hypothetical protein DCX16_04425, partial [bacterium]|nr:hypothetical protein [bacterium]
TYTVQVERQFYVFENPTITVSIDWDRPNEIFNFIGRHMFIKGSITENGGPLIATITLTGQETKTILANGSYTFKLPSVGTYTVQVERQFYVFENPTITVSIDWDRPNEIFNFIGRHMFIKGSITENGDPLIATITLTGQETKTILANGSYIFELPLPGTYTVQVEKQFYVFDFPTMTVSIDWGHPNEIFNFIGRHMFVKGSVTENGSPSIGAVVSIGISSCTTSEDGSYIFKIQEPGEYIISVFKEYYCFSPREESISINYFAPSHKKDFLAAPLYIKGSITSYDGTLIEATITVTGDYSTSTLAVKDSYYIPIPIYGTYTIMPEKEYWCFRPASKTFVDLSSGVKADFEGGIPPIIEGITPNKGKNTEKVSVTITGAFFSTNTTALLLDKKGSLTFTGTTSIVFVFDIIGIKPGTYSLILANNGYSSTLTDCFFVSAELSYIRINPENIYLSDEQTVIFTASGYDRFDYKLDLDYLWEASCGTISRTTGTWTNFTAGTLGTTGSITASQGAITKTATITILGASFLSIEGPSTQTAGYSATWTIRALDRNNNFASSYNSKIKIMGQDINVSQGIATWTKIFEKSGTETITCYDIRLESISGSTTVYIEPQEALSITVSADDISVDIGSTTIFAYVTDKFGNPVRDGTIVRLQIIDGTGSLNTSVLTTENGTATAILFSRKVEKKIIKGEVGLIDDTKDIEFLPGETKNLSLLVEDSIAGSNIIFTCISYDSYENHTPDFFATVTFESNYPYCVTYTIRGSRTFHLLFTKSGTYTATITANGLFAEVSFTVHPSYLNRLKIDVPDEIVVGSWSYMNVFAYDSYNNQIEPKDVIIKDSMGAISSREISPTKYEVKIDMMGSNTIIARIGLIKGTITVYVLGTPTKECVYGSNLATITISAGSFDSPYKIFIATQTTNLPPGNIGFGLSVTSDKKGSGTFVLEVPYKDSDNDNIVDGTDIDERTLLIYHYENGRWRTLISKPIPEKNVVIGTTSTLSLFALAGSSGASKVLKKVPVFPNPYRYWEKNKHKGKIAFGDKNSPPGSEKRLPSPVTIRIFNSTGELILEKENLVNHGYWEWYPGNIASGVYFYQLKYGKDKVFGKIGIIK